MSYTTKTEETKKFDEPKFIAPGVNEVKITAIDAVEPEGKAPYLNLKFENKKGQTTEDKLYFSDAAKPYSETCLGEIKKALGTDTEVTGKTLTEFSKNLFKVIGNKMFRHRFTAQEIAGKLNSETGEQKRNWFKAKIGRRFSSESISTNPSRLKDLDKSNKYDYEMLPTADTATTNGKETAGEELPF